jgi:hypothetical protein
MAYETVYRFNISEILTADDRCRKIVLKNHTRESPSASEWAKGIKQALARASI